MVKYFEYYNENAEKVQIFIINESTDENIWHFALNTERTTQENVERFNAWCDACIHNDNPHLQDLFVTTIYDNGVFESYNLNDSHVVEVANNENGGSQYFSIASSRLIMDISDTDLIDDIYIL